MADDKEKQTHSTSSGQAPSTGSSGQAPSTGSGQAPSTSSGQAGKADPASGTTKKNTKGGRGPRHVQSGVAHIKATFNNTMVSITDMNGGVIAWSSAGRVGFSGSRKSTAFAATLVGQESGRQAVGKGMREIEVRVQGAGAGRESAIRALQSSGLNISVIKDVTPVPHNGCRARKRRRV